MYKVVVIGGGTGQGNLLRGFKDRKDVEISAIVTVADDGGGSGKIMLEMQSLPIGDVRNCLLSLSHMDELTEKLMNHRFTYGSLKGQSFGNLFLLALSEIYGDFENAINCAGKILSSSGVVIPASLKPIRLMATLSDETVVVGESRIAEICSMQNAHISKMEIIPENASATLAAVEKISSADMIIIGPGSIYTSIIPNLLIKDIRDAIKYNLNAEIVYISNIMTEKGESENLDLLGHIKEIIKYLSTPDYVIINTDSIPYDAALNYAAEGKRIILPEIHDIEKISSSGIKPITGKIIKRASNGSIVHDGDKVADIIIEILQK